LRRRASTGEGHEVDVDWAQFGDGNGGKIELFDHVRFGKGLDFPLPRANANDHVPRRRSRE
jgi:hypothetical protein